MLNAFSKRSLVFAEDSTPDEQTKIILLGFVRMSSKVASFDLQVYHYSKRFQQLAEDTFGFVNDRLSVHDSCRKLCSKPFERWPYIVSSLLQQVADTNDKTLLAAELYELFVEYCDYFQKFYDQFEAMHTILDSHLSGKAGLADKYNELMQEKSPWEEVVSVYSDDEWDSDEPEFLLASRLIARYEHLCLEFNSNMPKLGKSLVASSTRWMFNVSIELTAALVDVVAKSETMVVVSTFREIEITENVKNSEQKNMQEVEHLLS